LPVAIPSAILKAAAHPLREAEGSLREGFQVCGIGPSPRMIEASSSAGKTGSARVG
jgi:hypothetical protein